MDGSTSNFDGNYRIENPDSMLERLQITVFVREYAKPTRVNSQADTGMHVLFGRFKPSITRRLYKETAETRYEIQADEKIYYYLFKDVV
jgi:hypothetical protein